MIPTTLLGTAKIPNDGGELKLTHRDNDFYIQLTGVHGELMSSRMYSSEVALAELGCAHLHGVENAKVLVGGLSIGSINALFPKINNHQPIEKPDNSLKNMLG